VRQDVASQDAPVACTEGMGCFDKFPLLCRQNLSANQTRISHPTSDNQRQDEIDQTWSQERHKGDREQNSGERKKRVHHDDIDKAIYESAVVPGERTD